MEEGDEARYMSRSAAPSRVVGTLCTDDDVVRRIDRDVRGGGVDGGLL